MPMCNTHPPTCLITSSLITFTHIRFSSQLNIRGHITLRDLTAFNLVVMQSGLLYCPHSGVSLCLHPALFLLFCLAFNSMPSFFLLYFLT